MYVNGYLRWTATKSEDVLARLKKSTDRVGGWDKAMAFARINRHELDSAAQRTDSGVNTPEESCMDVTAPSVLRQRLFSTITREGSYSQSISRSASPIPEELVAQHTLIDHPDPEISKLATEYSELDSELTSTGPEHLKWPANITWKNFAVYQLIPTLVYELEFPRTNRRVDRFLY
jgi:sterol O-acyltransferase